MVFSIEYFDVGGLKAQQILGLRIKTQTVFRFRFYRDNLSREDDRLIRINIETGAQTPLTFLRLCAVRCQTHISTLWSDSPAVKGDRGIYQKALLEIAVGKKRIRVGRRTIGYSRSGPDLIRCPVLPDIDQALDDFLRIFYRRRFLLLPENHRIANVAVQN